MVVFLLLYIILNIICIYIDYSYHLNGFLLIPFYLLTVLIFFYKNKNNQRLDFNKKVFLNNLFFILLFIISLHLIYNILLFIIIGSKFEDIKITSGIAIVKAIVLYPILEELIFRRYLLSLLVNKYSPYKAILILSLGFSITHIFTNSGLLFVFIMSLFLSWVYVKTKNIFLCFTAHIVVNSISVFFFEMMYYTTKNVLILILSASIFALILSFIALKARFKYIE
jgi:membrane protease YdiL (CAAX protease family)